MLRALSSFWFEPEEFSFPTQDEGEKIVLFLRAHLITLVPPFIIFLLGLILPVLVFSTALLPGFDLSQILPQRFIVLITFAYYLFLFGFGFFRFLLWYFNIYLVTNERVIDFDFTSFLHREISDCLLSNIQDVTSQIVGPAHTFFNYGHIFVQTAAVNPVFEFHNVPKPNLVVKEISKQVRLEEAEPKGAVA